MPRKKKTVSADTNTIPTKLYPYTFVADEMIGELWAMVGLFTFVSVIVWICLAVW